MILVSILVFLFIWVYQRKSSNPNKLKMGLSVLVFGIFVSFLVSAVSVCGFYGVYNFEIRDLEDITTTLSLFSLPLHLKTDFMPLWQGWPPGPDPLFIEISFASAKLSEMELWLMRTGEGGFICPSKYSDDVDYTASVITHLFFTFTAFNMIGLPLAILTYNMRGILEKLNSRIIGFKERYKDNSLYQWLFPE